MSQSLSILYTHATFGTKGRNPWINKEIADDLYAYMASTLKALDSPAVILNSMPDHIHILFRISKSITIAEVIEETMSRVTSIPHPGSLVFPTFYRS